MTEKDARTIVEMSDVLYNKELPDASSITVILGNYTEVTSLSTLRKFFSDIKLLFVSDGKSTYYAQYAVLDCKIDKESIITFEARVPVTELSETKTESVSYVLPALEHSCIPEE